MHYDDQVVYDETSALIVHTKSSQKVPVNLGVLRRRIYSTGDFSLDVYLNPEYLHRVSASDFSLVWDPQPATPGPLVEDEDESHIKRGEN